MPDGRKSENNALRAYEPKRRPRLNDGAASNFKVTAVLKKLLGLVTVPHADDRGSDGPVIKIWALGN